MAGLDKFIYHLYRRKSIDRLQLTGKTVGTDTVLLYDGNDDILLATGTSVPGGTTTGYAKGGLYIKTDAGAGTRGLYENKGTNTSCDFDIVGDIAAGDLTLADGKVYIGDAAGSAAAKTPSGDITITREGIVAIGAGKVTAAKTSMPDGTVFIGGVGNIAAEQTPSGDVTVTNAGVTVVGAGKITNAMRAALSEGWITRGDAGNVPEDYDASGDGFILIGDGTTLRSVQAAGDVTIDNLGNVAVSSGVIERAMLESTVLSQVDQGSEADSKADSNSTIISTNLSAMSDAVSDADSVADSHGLSNSTIISANLSANSDNTSAADSVADSHGSSNSTIISTNLSAMSDAISDVDSISDSYATDIASDATSSADSVSTITSTVLSAMSDAVSDVDSKADSISVVVSAHHST